MREIKFRAWDKENECWYSPVHEAYRGNLWELLVSFGGDLVAHNMNGVEHQSLWPNRYELMQYTGLKDKNGKEIYEGDIVEYQVFAKTFRGRRKNGKCRHNVEFKDSIIPGFNISANAEYEVIGNIYENPELINL